MPPVRASPDALRGGRQAQLQPDVPENADKVSGAEFVWFDMHIKTNLPELGMNQSRSNIELFGDWFTDGSVVSRHSLPRPTLFTTGTFTWQHVLGHDPPQVKT